MTRDDIIRLAVQCQLVNAGNREGLYMDALAEFANLIAEHERAECDGGQCGIGGYCKQCPKTQPEQEPVAWADKVDIDRDGHDLWVSRQKPAKDGVPLYTAPPQREWVGLTEEERLEILGVGGEAAVLYVTEAKLREKNK